MFMGKKVPPIPQKRYDIAKKASEKYNSKTSLKILIIAADTLPYDQNICNLLAEKFENMQMPRCAAIMKTRAGESPKLIIEQPPAAATVSKSEPPQDRNTAPQNIIEGTKAASAPQKTPKNQTGKTTPGSDINFTNLL